MELLQDRLKRVIDEAQPNLTSVGEESAAYKSHPDKWSKKEILGHLIDSASNNHQRFVRANFQDNLVFNGYVQDGWVELQQYQNADWQRLIDLWYQYNWHLSILIGQIPDEVMNKQHLDHNLDQIAYKKVSKEQATSLSYFIKDYIDHLEHHLRQIL